MIREKAQLKLEQEQEAKKQALLDQHAQEEAKLLEELKKKYEEELAEQEKAIQNKYVKIEEEKIFSIVSDEKPAAKKAKKTTTAVRKTEPKKAVKGKGKENR